MSIVSSAFLAFIQREQPISNFSGSSRISVDDLEGGIGV